MFGRVVLLFGLLLCVASVGVFAQGERRPDGPWRVAGADSATVPRQVRLSELLPLPPGAREIHISDITFDPVVHEGLIHEGASEGLRVLLAGLRVIPFRSMQPDTTVPFGFGYGPNPRSVLKAEFVLLAESDFEVRVLTKDLIQIVYKDEPVYRPLGHFYNPKTG